MVTETRVPKVTRVRRDRVDGQRGRPSGHLRRVHLSEHHQAPVPQEPHPLSRTAISTQERRC